MRIFAYYAKQLTKDARFTDEKEERINNMSGYVAVYKCRLCGRKYYDTLLKKKYVEKCLRKFQNGKPYYKPVPISNDVHMIGVHDCGNYCKGISDFCGFEARWSK